MLEKLLQDLIAALNANTAAHKGAPAPAAAAAAAPAAPAGLTQEQMQAKLKALMDAKGKDVVVKIFAEMNAKKLSDIKAEQYAILDAKVAAAMTAETPLF
jgi:hypothetical protein